MWATKTRADISSLCFLKLNKTYFILLIFLWPHTQLDICLFWLNVCHSATPFALDLGINQRTPPPSSFFSRLQPLSANRSKTRPSARCWAQLFTQRSKCVHMFRCTCTHMPAYFNVCVEVSVLPQPGWFLCQNQFASRWQWNPAGKPPRRGMR